MPHPFQDKLIVFIGNPKRGTRQEARDALSIIGGVPDERITMFTHYIVAFNGANKTKVYRKAVEHDEYGLSVLLNEEQFFDILDGKAEPPARKKPKLAEGVIMFPTFDQQVEDQFNERAEQYVLAKKRIKSIARYGIPTPDGGRTKADFGALEPLMRVASFRNSVPDTCDICGKPATVYIGDGNGNETARFCLACHNKMMAELTETDAPDNIPDRLSVKLSRGKTHNFMIEPEIFSNGKLLTATEIGKAKRRIGVHGELDENFDDMFETLKRRIKKALSVTYMDPNGYFANSRAVGYIDYNRVRDAHDIVIDGKPYTWDELKKNVAAHEGWQIKIEFRDVGEELV